MCEFCLLAFAVFLLEQFVVALWEGYDKVGRDIPGFENILKHFKVFHSYHIPTAIYHVRSILEFRLIMC